MLIWKSEIYYLPVSKYNKVSENSAVDKDLALKDFRYMNSTETINIVME